MLNGTIRRVRIEKGLSGRQFAEACKVSPKAIWAIENYKGTPSLNTVAKIANFLKISPRELEEKIQNDIRNYRAGMCGVNAGLAERGAEEITFQDRLRQAEERIKFLENVVKKSYPAEFESYIS